MSTPTEEISKVADLTRGIKFAMLVTTDEDGSFISRPMAHQEVEFDGDLWFFASSDSRKVNQIAANPKVGVTLASSNTWVSIAGTAAVVTDVAKAKDLWSNEMEAWFPQGPEDPSVVLIKVTSDSAEYWDTPGGRVASVLSFIKVKTTGERYNPGENAKVEL